MHRERSDRVFRAVTVGAALSTFVILVLIGTFLAIKGWPAVHHEGVARFFTSAKWLVTGNARASRYGISALVVGTLLISLVALSIALPLAIATALFINEYAPRRLRVWLIAFVDLLAAVPSLIYGFWGRDVAQGAVSGTARWLHDWLGWIPIFRAPAGAKYTNSTFVAGVVLSLMILPIATAVIREVFSQTPPGEKEGALALGATRWGMIRSVVLPFGRGGIVGGAMLALGRALGETIAVALIISPRFVVSARILPQGANSVASHIALNFGEATGLTLNALVAAGFALFVMTLVVNVAASAIVSRSRSGAGVEI